MSRPQLPPPSPTTIRAFAFGAILALTAGCSDAVKPSASPATAAPFASSVVVATPATAASPSHSATYLAVATWTPGRPAPSTGQASPQTDWSLDLFDKSGIRHQNPDGTACTAASVQTALNLISLDGGATRWSPSTSYENQEAILQFERSNMTLPAWVPGSDPHGTRNALNFYGWGSMEAGVYVDAAYPTFADAARAVVASIARTRKPAVVFAWMGGHAQLVTGYRAQGEDPARSANFAVVGIYLTDPLQGTGTLVYDGETHDVQAVSDDTWVSVSAWKNGADELQFNRYWQPDSILRDSIDGNVGRTEWYNRWVAVLATR